MLNRGRNIPTFTYDPLFNLSETVIQWFFLSEWVLMSNARWAGMVESKGFARDRIHVVGSTLADLAVEKRGVRQAGNSNGKNILVLTKPAHRSISNYPILDSVINVVQETGVNYKLFVRPHPADRSSYEGYEEKYGDKLFVSPKGTPLYDDLRDKDIIVVFGISNVIFECLPTGRPIYVVDLTDNTDRGFLNREDMRKAISFFGSLNAFQQDLRQAVTNNINREYGIPQSIVDDFYYKLDGNTSERICDFVLGKVTEANVS